MIIRRTRYEALTEHDDDARWAFGTGFADPLAGVDTAVPDGVDAADLAAYCLMLGDDALVMSHRLQQWCTTRPELEEEVALANIALDLLGQARLLLAGPARSTAPGRERGRPGLLPRRRRVPQRRGWPRRPTATSRSPIVRLLVFATWRLALLRPRSPPRADPVLAAIAAKGVKELAYHRELRRAVGGPARRRHRRVAPQRMQAALDAVWPLAGELFAPHEVERAWPRPASPSTRAVRARGVRRPCSTEVLGPATLRPSRRAARRRRARRAGRDGEHTAATGASCSPSCRAWPARTRGRRGDAPPTGRARRIAATVHRPGAADADPGRPRRPARGRRIEPDGPWSSSITPTYSGCPAMDEMRDDLPPAAARPASPTSRCAPCSDPPWTTDWITEAGPAKLAEAGIAPPGPGAAPAGRPGAADAAARPAAGRACPHCGSADTAELSRVRRHRLPALRRCRGCREPFEHVKEI